MKARKLFFGCLLTGHLTRFWVCILSCLSYAEVRADVDLNAFDKIPPMEFLVARGAPNACGEGCDTWIAAEGRFDAETPDRFRLLLNQIGEHSIPIFFSSRGGDLNAALELGRVLRAHSMRAGIGTTRSVACVTIRGDKLCNSLLPSDPKTRAVLSTKDARCTSACAFAFLGAVYREVAPDSHLGIHSPTFDMRKLGPISEEQMRLVEAQLHHADISTYFSEMGISNSLFDIVKKTKVENLHLLTRRELYDFGIDQREWIESEWTVDSLEFSANGKAAIKDIALRTSASTLQFERYAFAISCDYRPNAYVMSVLRYFPDTTNNRPVDIDIGSGSSAVHFTAKSAYPTPYRADSIEVRQSKLRKDALENLIGSSKINVDEKTIANNGESTVLNNFSIKMQGAKDAFEAITNSCPSASP